MNIFDSTSHNHKPNMPSSFKRIHNVNENFIFDGQTPDTLNLTKLKNYVKNDAFLFFDIESPGLIEPETLETIALEADKLGVATYGFYGFPFFETFNDETAFDNHVLKYNKLYKNVDALFPSMYVYEQTEKEWMDQFDGLLYNSRRHFPRLPIYPFLWWIHPYHNPNPPIEVDPKFWRFMLNQVRRKADGCVIWGGWQQEWDASASWWLTLNQYL